VSYVLPQKQDDEKMSYYTIYFDLNKSDVRSDQQYKIAALVNDIERYQPEKIHISGYAGRSGTAEHNMKLSKERAQMVQNELLAQGVEVNSVDKRGYGETHLAVQTEDGVRMPENRRVVVSFERGER
jgi:outer membrane protein OmpA-like peptidoglycan-associated protein